MTDNAYDAMRAPSPHTAAGMILDALEAVVAALELAGLPATRDPGDFQPPGALVAAPTLTGVVTLQSIGLEVPVWLVHVEPGVAGLDWLLEAATVAVAALGTSVASPAVWSSPLNPNGLPAYLITVRVNVATT